MKPDPIEHGDWQKLQPYVTPGEVVAALVGGAACAVLWFLFRAITA